MEEVIIAAQKNIPYMNKFELVGSVVHKYRPQPDVIIVTIAVSGHEFHDVDYPNVVFYGAERADAIDKSIDCAKGAYPRVRVSGIIQTTRKEVDGVTRYFQSLVGTYISRTQTNMERLTGQTGVGTHKAESVNDICLLGQVTYIRPLTKEGSDRIIGVLVTLRTVTEGRQNYPRVMCFNGNVNAAMELAVGDVVCATAYAETTSKERDGERIRYETIVATEIAKVPVGDEA